MPNHVGLFRHGNALLPASVKEAQLHPGGILREEGVPQAEVTPLTERPLFVEVPIGVLAGAEGGQS